MDGNNAGTNEARSAAFVNHAALQAASCSEGGVGQVTGVAASDSFPGFPHQGYSEEELVEIQDQLASLMSTTTTFPVECSLGDCAFLFESRDDIAVIVGSLEDQITKAPRNA
jgi:hypothetical protein